MIGTIWQRSTVWLLASAAGRLRESRPDWADAMLAEADFCESGRDRFGWAWGCWVASLRASGWDAFTYPLALSIGLATMTGYEWSVDETHATVVVLSLIALALGALRPRLAPLSGALVGLVVAGVIGFEALSGIRPAYEAQAQTLARSLFWLVLLAPAVLSAAAGAWIGRRRRPGTGR